MTTALIVHGGLASHEPRETSEMVAGILAEDGIQTTLSGTLDILADVQTLQSYDLIIPNWSVGTISDEQANGLRQAVESGVVLGCWHGGLTTIRHTTANLLIGGRFLNHPGGKIDYPVHIKDQDHPITAGLDDFTLQSEQYYMHVDPSNSVLATTTFSGEHIPWLAGIVMPVVWTRRWGQARVFYCALGHDTADLALPQVRTLIRRGLLWALGMLP